MRSKKLLVPVDFSKVSKNTVAFALDLAKLWNAKILFVHGFRVAFATYERPSMSPTVEPISTSGPSEEELSREKLSNFLGTFPHLDAVAHSDIVGLGPAVNIIEQTADNENVDLVVMGTTGASEVEGFFIGTNSEKVSRKSPCPVLVIPVDFKKHTIKTVCLALDDPNNNDVPLKILIDLLSAFNAKLRIVHISTNDETAFSKEKVLQRYQEPLSRIEHSFHVFYNENPQEGLKEFLDKYPIDLMALMYRQHSFLERLFQPGTRKKMVFKTEIPLLVLK
ncbi:universal stress protein [Pricia sp. S334]|uniref:Universal stress protein n=1 Tax=Pricia mediterranea TaxID=3076079 RepID=A0ABU3L1V9_9FLAO|nr:universal stress protein [Pricia sp. S334]MDT7827568.1 universal stress protein [Pricia sp. S334]